MTISRSDLRRIILEEMRATIIEDDNPCWDDYSPGSQSGKKTKIGKSGKRVPNCEEINEDDENFINEAEYKGKKVKLNKSRRIRKGEPGYGKSQMVVFVNSGKKNADGTVRVKAVRFGDPKSRIKKSNPKRRKSFRARHNCDDPGPKTKARYWSCKAW
jgi:hypothetical protein